MLGRLLRATSVSVVSAFCVSALLLAEVNSPVADAAMRGDKDAVRSLLKNAEDVNASQGDGMTALHWAAMKGDAELADMLIYAGANVKATTRINSYTPLYLASERGYVAVMERLLTAGADPKAGTPGGVTPLMVAAGSGAVDAVKLLLDRGADVNAKETVRGQTALMFAAASNRAAVAELLVKRGADLTATSRVVTLANLGREQLGFGGNPAVPGQEPPPGQAQPGRGGRAGGPPQGQRAGGPAGAPAQAQAQAAAPGNEPPAGGGRFGRGGGTAGVDRQFSFNELVHTQGGLTPLLYAVRQGHTETARTLLDGGANINLVSAGDRTSPLLMAVINGHFDLAKELLDRGADPNLSADNGAAPLYAALNCEWAPKALYPQPRAYLQQKTTYLDLMKALLAKGADPNARLRKKVWYSGYNFDLSGVDEIGATPFWRAAYASDVEAMKLLVASGADASIPTMKPAGRPRTGDAIGRDTIDDVSGMPPIPTGGPGVPPLLAAAGVGYGEGFAANAHRFAPGGMLAAVKYLVEDLHADVNARDHEGNTALHDAAARGDNEMIQYLLSKGADPKIVNREGNTTIDMANGPVQRIQPFPETIALLEKLGVKNNHKCKSC
jgi:ankyrin repeat protein